jgi:hypothetical protein
MGLAQSGRPQLVPCRVHAGPTAPMTSKLLTHQEELSFEYSAFGVMGTIFVHGRPESWFLATSLGNHRMVHNSLVCPRQAELE